MRRISALSFVLLVFSVPLSAADPPEIFAKAKEQFKLAAYPAALETLQKLEAETLKPHYQKERAALLPALHFYRGASYAALGRLTEAREQFEIFLTYQPDVSLDPGLYPKKVIDTLEETRQALAKKSKPGEAPLVAGSLGQSYAAFSFAMQPDETAPDESWADGPARWILTPSERRDFEGLGGPAARSEFVAAFWRTRDPKPETADNEFREEFEKRVAFADSRFTQDETRGALTDRGMVFIVMGAPSYIGRKPLTAGDDADDPEWWRRQRSHVIWSATSPVNRAQQTGRAESSPGGRVTDSAANWREVWHYRREHLPKDVPYLQVDFEFVTKKGYGRSVLQRDSSTLDTLDRAKSRLRQGKA